MSSLPNAYTVSATARRLSARLATSPAMPMTASPNSERSSSARVATRSITPTRAPSSIKRATTARPMPEPPPVTSATCPSSQPMTHPPRDRHRGSYTERPDQCSRDRGALSGRSDKGLLVEPGVFHAPAVEDAVDHDRHALDVWLHAGAAAAVEDDRPGIVLSQRSE